MQTKSNQYRLEKAFASIAMTISIMGTSGIALATPYVHSAKLVGGAITTTDWNNIGETLNGIDNSGGAGTSWGFGMTSTGTATIESAGGIIVNAGGADITGIVTANDGVAIDTITLDAATITDTATTGLSYAGDYSANNVTNDRWLVDKGYVDSEIVANAVGASNGITNNSGTVELGGSLTKNTNITGAFEINIGDPNGVAVSSFNSYSTGNSLIGSDSLVSIFAPVNNARLSYQPTGAVPSAIATTGYVDGAYVQATESDLGIAKIATQAITNVGTNDTDIVTPLKLTSYLANAGINPVAADNGLHFLSNTVKIGGILTENTQIGYESGYGGSDYTLTLRSGGDSNYDFSHLYLSPTGFRLQWEDTFNAGKIKTDSTGVEMVVDGTSNSTHGSRIRINNDANQTMTIGGDIVSKSFSGVQYEEDYSANYVARTLVDKAYVDAAVASSIPSEDLGGAGTLEPPTADCDEAIEAGTVRYVYNAGAPDGDRGQFFGCVQVGVGLYDWVVMTVFSG